MQELYFDYSATTPCDRAVLEEMNRFLNVEFGNPSSLHQKGMLAEVAIKTATSAIAKTSIEGRRIRSNIPGCGRARSRFVGSVKRFFETRNDSCIHDACK